MMVSFRRLFCFSNYAGTTCTNYRILYQFTYLIEQLVKENTDKRILIIKKYNEIL